LYNEHHDNCLNIQECGLFISKERPYLGASPDRLLAETSVIEVKCPYSSRNMEVSEKAFLIYGRQKRTD